MRMFGTPGGLWCGFALASLATGCDSDALEVAITVVYPDDASPLASVDNVSVTLAPDGFSETLSSDGPDFSLEVELDPDGIERTLAIFLARGDELLGHGATPPFSYQAASDAGVGVLVGYPGTLATLPGRFALPDASVSVAPAGGFGVVALAGDGSTLFFDAYTLDFRSAATLELPQGAIPLPDDGIFVGDSGAGVTRIAAANGLRGFRYALTSDSWNALELGELAQADRIGAALLFDETDDSVLVFGGGEQTDTLRLAIEAAVTGATDPPPLAAEPLALDGPRSGASASWLGTGENRIPILVGNTAGTPAPPVVWAPSLSQAAGDSDPWAGLSCVALALPDASEASLLCGGGNKAGAPTADALRISVQAGSLQVEALPDLFAAPPGDVRWFSDDLAVYAQGAGRFFRIDRATSVMTEPTAASPRISGGSTAVLPSGGTVLVGGIDAQGAPVDVWQLFSPQIGTPGG